MCRLDEALKNMLKMKVDDGKIGFIFCCFFFVVSRARIASRNRPKSIIIIMIIICYVSLVGKYGLKMLSKSFANRTLNAYLYQLSRVA